MNLKIEKRLVPHINKFCTRKGVEPEQLINYIAHEFLVIESSDKAKQRERYQARVKGEDVEELVTFAKHCVSSATGIPSALICDKTRVRRFVDARRLLFFALRTYTSCSLNEISRHCRMTDGSVLDHATIIHMVNTHRELVLIDAAYRAMWVDCKELIEQKVNELISRS